MKLRRVRIADTGWVVTGKTPPTKQPEFFDGEYPFITPSDLEYDSYRVSITEKTVTDEAKAKFANQFIPAGAVTFTCIASIGKIGIAERNSLTNQQINSLVANDQHDSRFLYYLLRRETKRIQGLCSGVATPIINKSDFERIEVDVPDLEIQREIADILSAYDDLMENNRRRMALLEEAARQLYREWFVRLRFPGHEHTRITNGVPEGWERKPIGEVATLNYGKALKEENRLEGATPVYGSSGVVGNHSEAPVTGPGIVVGRKGNVGSVFWSDTPFWPIDTVYFVSPEESSLFLYHCLKNVAFQSSDVAVPGLNRTYAHSLKILVPSRTVRAEFEEAVAPMFEQLARLRTMNEKLRAARDLLLPRLMGGEIAV